jgi:glycosyltransferase involved in cell wall biosynthesis
VTAVTVAIPVRDGGELFRGTLAALARQTIEHELLVCDSGSIDQSDVLAAQHGARVLRIEPTSFSHGGTRNLLMREARGTHVALLTQDAEPRDDDWLERLVGGFSLAGDVAVTYGPYCPRPSASFAVRLELEQWFASLSPDGRARIDRLAPQDRGLSVLDLMGRRGFLTDANSCLLRSAWERVPFRDVPYAEDRVLAVDMLRAGYAKAFIPDAGVLHSHQYTSWEELRRCFDEWRGLREVYGWREPSSPLHLARRLRGELSAARRELDRQGMGTARRCATLAALSRHHVIRLMGSQLGSRADVLAPPLRRVLSLERRSNFLPTRLDAPAARDPQEDQPT